MQAAGLARSTFFYHQARLGQGDKYAELKDVIRVIFDGVKQRYGYQRVLGELRRQGWQAGHKLVYKLMKQMGLI